MTSKVVELRPKPAQIAHVLSMGHTHHRIVENLVARNAFPFRRVLVDASHVRTQHDLIRALKAKGIQVVLDPKSIELSLPGGITGATRALPWSPMLETLSDRRALREYCKRISNFAVTMGVDVILAPSHYIASSENDWNSIDSLACEILRAELDAAGGKSIAIDYLVCGNLTQLHKIDARQQLKSRLSCLPIDSIWLRADGFGHDATCAGIRKAVDLCLDLGNDGRPVVLDRASGVTAMVLASLGASGGISHGISNYRERFDSYHLRKPPLKQNGQGGGSAKWIYVPALDSHLKSKDFESIIEVKGAKSRLLCTDSCCPTGAQSTINNYVRHSIVQRAGQVARLNEVQEANRPNWLLASEIDVMGRNCRRLIKALADVDCPAIHKKLDKQSKKMDDLHELTTELVKDYGRARTPNVPALHISQIMPEVSGY